MSTNDRELAQFGRDLGAGVSPSIEPGGMLSRRPGGGNGPPSEHPGQGGGRPPEHPGQGHGRPPEHPGQGHGRTPPTPRSHATLF